MFLGYEASDGLELPRAAVRKPLESCLIVEGKGENPPEIPKVFKPSDEHVLCNIIQMSLGARELASSKRHIKRTEKIFTLVMIEL